MCKPVGQRSHEGDVGCWILAEAPSERAVEPQLYWHLDAYATRAAPRRPPIPFEVIIRPSLPLWVPCACEIIGLERNFG